MVDFRLQAPYIPTGDQPEAIEKLLDGINQGMRHQVLLGATGTGGLVRSCPSRTMR